MLWRRSPYLWLPGNYREKNSMKFIFEVLLDPGFTAEEYAQNWVKASEIIQQNPGANGTYLHRDLNWPDRLLAIAHWDSREARDEKDDNKSELVRTILAEHAKKCQINVIGEFDEPEWSVCLKKP